MSCRRTGTALPRRDILADVDIHLFDFYFRPTRQMEVNFLIWKRCFSLASVNWKGRANRAARIPVLLLKMKIANVMPDGGVSLEQDFYHLIIVKKLFTYTANSRRGEWVYRCGGVGGQSGAVRFGFE